MWDTYLEELLGINEEKWKKEKNGVREKGIGEGKRWVYRSYHI